MLRKEISWDKNVQDVKGSQQQMFSTYKSENFIANSDSVRMTSLNSQFRNGFWRIAKSSNTGIKPNVLAWRNEYLRILLNNRAKPENSKLQKVNLDNSCIHQRYCRHEDSIYDPNDEQDFLIIDPQKGSRIFLPAIRFQCNGHDSRVITNSIRQFSPSEKVEKVIITKHLTAEIFWIGLNFNYFQIQLSHP